MPDVISRDRVESVVFEALERFGVEPSEISRGAQLKDLQISSLDLVELSQIVQEEFGVEIRPDEAKDLRTLDDVIELVAGRAT
jgi:acyl carrier protein